MKLLRYNSKAIEIPSEIILDVNFHAKNLLAITTTENTVEYGYCLQFENDALPINIALYNEPIGEWFVDPNKVDRIVATNANLNIYFKDNKRNICNACRFC